MTRAEIRFTLLPDGSSDQALIPIIRWTLRQHIDQTIAINGDWADLRQLRRLPRDLSTKVSTAVKLFPCDILFVHRDAEEADPELRSAEAEHAVKEATLPSDLITVPVVPVRMTEAWLLFDQKGIRHAAGNPNGTVALPLPDWRRAEELSDPKDRLFEVLKIASELPARRLRQFNVHYARTRIADFIDDFSPLRNLPSYRRFEEHVTDVCQRAGWLTRTRLRPRVRPRR